MIKKLPVIGVMGSGKQKQARISEPLGEALAHLPVHLLTGGGYGVMQSVAKGFTSVADRQGFSMGCIPMKENDQGAYDVMSPSYPNQYVEIPIYTPLGVYTAEDPEKVNRNYINILSSDAVIALPGSKGTQQEIELARRFNKAVLIYDPENSFECEQGTTPRVQNLPEVISWVKATIGPAALSL